MRFFTGAACAVALGDVCAMAHWLGRVAVIEQGQFGGFQGHGAGMGGLRFQCRCGGQQAEGPDRTAVGVHAVGGGEHRLLTFAAQSAEGFAQG